MNESYKNIRVEHREDRIAVLTLDKKDSPVNVLSRDVLLELEAAFLRLKEEKPAGLIIKSGKKDSFIAGADINEFVLLKDRKVALESIQKGQSVFQIIEDMPFPTVAAIHGVCLGGGLELSLACDYRIASDEEKTMLGLPEVKLGIHPGFGGSVRSVRLLGVTGAMGMMLTGRSLRASQARRMGLVDMMVPLRHLERGALSLIQSKPPLHRPGLATRLLNHWPLRPLIASMITKQTAKKARIEHYPAPFALIRVWKKNGHSFRRMMEAEAASVADLIVGNTARNLIRVFFLQEQLKSLGKKGKKVPGRIHVVGAGIMGGDIAAYSAYRGLRVSLQDREIKFIAPAIKRAAGFYIKKLKKERPVQERMDNLIPDEGGVYAASADLVIEAIFENRDAKRSLFQDLERKLPAGAILATNTSSIPIDQLTEGLKHPENLVGIHFFNPVAQMPLVEIVRGEKTGQDALDTAFAYTGRIGKLPLPVKNSPGFLVNRVLMAYLMEAMIMEEEGFSPSSIDATATKFGMPMGPLFLADTIGLDVCYHVAKVFEESVGGIIPPKLKRFAEEGNLGKKSGQGYYSHKAKKKKPAPSTGKRPVQGDAEDRLILSFLNTAVACLREGIVENVDLLDAGMIFGTGFAPFSGGPIHYAKAKGVTEIVERLDELKKVHGDRFAPDSGWSLIQGNDHETK